MKSLNLQLLITSLILILVFILLNIIFGPLRIWFNMAILLLLLVILIIVDMITEAKSYTEFKKGGDS